MEINVNMNKTNIDINNIKNRIICRIIKKNVVPVMLIVTTLAVLSFGIIRLTNDVSAAWKEDDKGKTYTLDDGKNAVGFEVINDKKYYFDNEGYLKIGKIYIEDEDAYYFADEEGVIQIGVVKKDDTFYVTDDTGKIKVGFVELDGNTYYFNTRAEQLFGWLKIDEDWYYADEKGIVRTGMLTINGKRYYLGTDGKRVSDAVMDIDGVTYVFSSDGSVDENATMLYPVYSFISQYRTSLGLSDVIMNKKVSACANARATELVNGYAVDDNGLELMLQNRGIKCNGGYEFSYGGVDGYGIEQLINNMKIDDRMINALRDGSVNVSGIGMHTEEDKTYFDIIIIEEMQ